MAINVEGLKELRRVVENIPASELNVGPWQCCIGGRAAADSYFTDRGMARAADGTPLFGHARAFHAWEAFLGIDTSKLMSANGYGGIDPGTVTHAKAFAIIDEMIEKGRHEFVQDICQTAVERAATEAVAEIVEARESELV